MLQKSHICVLLLVLPVCDGLGFRTSEFFRKHPFLVPFSASFFSPACSCVCSVPFQPEQSYARSSQDSVDVQSLHVHFAHIFDPKLEEIGFSFSCGMLPLEEVNGNAAILH